MDVELIFRRTLVYILALAAILGMCLLAVNLFQVLLASDQEPHVTVIAILSTLVVALLFSPVKNRIQEGIDRLFFRERYNSRRALLRLSQDLNADLDLGRMGGAAARRRARRAGRELAGPLPARTTTAASAIFKDLGCTPAACLAHLPPGGSLVRALAAGEPVPAEAHAELYPEAGPLDLSHYFPCRVKGELIAILGVGPQGEPSTPSTARRSTCCRPWPGRPPPRS